MVCRIPLSLTASSTPDEREAGLPGPSTKGLTGSKFYNACTTKVVRADKKIGQGGKVGFMPHEVAYVELKPSTATVTYIQTYVQKQVTKLCQIMDYRNGIVGVRLICIYNYSTGACSGFKIVASGQIANGV